jgi:hypothetical protein
VTRRPEVLIAIRRPERNQNTCCPDPGDSAQKTSGFQPDQLRITVVMNEVKL